MNCPVRVPVFIIGKMYQTLLYAAVEIPGKNDLPSPVLTHNLKAEH